MLCQLPCCQVDLTRYTMDTYMRIVTFKTAYYSFYLPVACGMILAGVEDQAAFATAKDILVEMGQYFQACPILGNPWYLSTGAHSLGFAHSPV